MPSTNLFVLADLLVLFAGESRVGYVVMHWTLKPDRFQRKPALQGEPWITAADSFTSTDQPKSRTGCTVRTPEDNGSGHRHTK